MNQLTYGDGLAVILLVAARMGLSPQCQPAAERQLKGESVHPIEGAAMEREAVKMNNILRQDAALIAQANSLVPDVAAKYGFAGPKESSNPITHEIRLNGQFLMGGQDSLAVIYYNLTGRNFENGPQWRTATHADYLLMMEGQLQVRFAGATLEFGKRGAPASLTHSFAL